MAVIYNDKVCVLACDVIRFDENTEWEAKLA